MFFFLRMKKNKEKFVIALDPIYYHLLHIIRMIMSKKSQLQSSI